MKKIFMTLIFIAIILYPVLPRGVDLDEIQTGKKITFINYPGPQNKTTMDVITGIGAAMARQIKAGNKIGKYANKYQVIHAFDPAETSKYDADILILTGNAKVNHIDSLRLIIAGYLETMYGYSARDARTLSKFITIYNAVYRGDLAYFSAKYKQVVQNHLKSPILGLSTNYKDWPGSTQIVIPITEDAKFNEPSSTDTSELSNKEVIDALKEQEDKGIEERKDLVEIKEKEVAEDKKEVEVAKEELMQEKQELEEKKEEVAAGEKEITEKEEEIKAEKEELTKITDEEEKKKKEEEITAREEVVTEKKEDVAEKKDEIKDTEDTIAEKEETITAKEEEIAEKEKEIEEDKEDIARDERIIEVAQDPEKVAEELIAREEDLKAQEENLKSGELDEKTFAGKFYYLQVEEYLTGGHYHNAMYILNANTGEVLIKAPDANIAGRKYDIAPSAGVVVITHKGTGDTDNYLSILDLDTLAIKYTSEDTVFHRSFLEVRENKYIYVVANLASSYYLGKYDLELNRVAVSEEKVHEDSYITFYNDRIYINSRDNKILALDKDDLSLIEKINPN